MSDATKARLPNTKVYVEGRYRKLSRDLPQTVFFCPECKGHPRRRRGCARCEGFGKLTRDSVQELVGWVAGSAFKTRKNKFHGAGREDIDVRMLGRGRPFVLELVNPKCLDVDLAAVESEINRRNEGRLEVLGLHWTEKTRVRAIKETPHAKEYEARVEIRGEPTAQAIAELVGRRIQVTQQTPARVAHRRADKARERWMEIVSFERTEDGEPAPGTSVWLVRIRTEHGTYVKEVVNGESGATTPSLADLLGLECRCVALDVVEILDVDGKAEEAPRAPAAFGENL